MYDKALSLRQPWASLIIEGYKTIETRTWPTKHRGKLYIHASRMIDFEAKERFKITAELPTGVLLGTVDLVKVIPFSRQDWIDLAEDHWCWRDYNPVVYAWHVKNPEMIKPFLPCKGSRNLFNVDIKQLQEA